MRAREYAVLWTDPAGQLLEKTADKQTQRKLLEAADGLARDPRNQGKALTHELAGFRRIRFSRYRILYTVDDDRGVVWVATIGIRREGSRDDVYELARKLFRAGLLDAHRE